VAVVADGAPACRGREFATAVRPSGHFVAACELPSVPWHQAANLAKAGCGAGGVNGRSIALAVFRERGRKWRERDAPLAAHEDARDAVSETVAGCRSALRTPVWRLRFSLSAR
jgi:hypothetical protein